MTLENRFYFTIIYKMYNHSDVNSISEEVSFFYLLVKLDRTR